MDEELFPVCNDALDRMRKAFEAGRGVRLRWEELEEMSRTFLGEIWSAERHSKPQDGEDLQ